MNTLSQWPIHTVPKHLTGFPVKVKTFASLFRKYTQRKELNSHHMSGGSYNTQLARGTRSAQLVWDNTISALQGTYHRKQDFPCTFQIKQCTQTHCIFSTQSFLQFKLNIYKNESVHNVAFRNPSGFDELINTWPPSFTYSYRLVFSNLPHLDVWECEVHQLANHNRGHLNKALKAFFYGVL